MSMRSMSVALAALACGLVFVPAAPAAGTAYKSCSGGYNNDGTPGTFYRKIRAKRVTCSTARSVTKAWIVYEAKTDGANPTATVKINGYSCKGSAVSAPGDPNGGLEVRCVRDGGRKAVRFYGHP
jgi:hypothetical protein